MTKNLLLVSIASPHKSGPESIQVGRYLSGLSKYFNVEFITTKPSSYGWANENSKGANNFNKNTKNIIELKGFDNKFLSKLKSFLPKPIKFPDSNFHFHLGIKKVIKKVTNEPNIIYSRSGSLSATLLAYKLSIHYKVPWVLHLSDPWVDSPFTTINLDQHRYWEKKCFSNAKAITVTTENYKILLSNKYPEYKNKIFTSYNVFENKAQSSNILGDKFKMIYTGNFYGNRTPKTLLDALKISYSTSPSLFKNVKLFFYGNMDTDNRNMILSYGFPFIKIGGSVKPHEVKNLIINSTIVINIEEPFKTPYDSLFLPSKVIDYMAIQKLILSISPRNSPSYNLINTNFGHSFTFNEHTKIANFILRALKEFKLGNTDFFKVNTPLKEYSSNFQAKKLTNILTKIVNK